MVKWLKSGLCKFGFMLSLLGAGTMNSGCEFLQPEGQTVTCEADGVISEQEEQDIIKIASKEHIILSEDDLGNERKVIKPVGVTQFEGPIQMFINDTDEFFNQEFEKRGLYRSGISDGLHIYLPKDENEFKEKYEMTHAHLCAAPSYVSAFYSGANNTVYIPKGAKWEYFFPIMHHEVGHSMRISDDEYPALANELYATLKLYALNKKLGSSVLTNLIGYYPREKFGNWEEGYLHNYQLSAIGYLMQANKLDGSLEKAVEYIMRVPKLNFEKEVRKTIDSYIDLRTAHMDQLNKLLDKPGFRDSFDKLNNKEFLELTDFIRASNFSSVALKDVFDKLNGEITEGLPEEELIKYKNPEILQKAVELSENFLSDVNNPFFKAVIVSNLNSFYELERRKCFDKSRVDWDLDDIKNYYDLNMKIIKLNMNYPCDFKYHECPRIIAEPGWDHVVSYLEVLRHNPTLLENNITDIDSLISLGNEFVDKFYRSKEFGFLENIGKSGRVSPVANYGPWINQVTAYLYINKMNNASSLEDYVYNCEKAKEFFEYSKLSSCEIIEDEEQFEKCRSILNANYYDSAIQGIERLGNCNEDL